MEEKENNKNSNRGFFIFFGLVIVVWLCTVIFIPNSDPFTGQDFANALIMFIVGFCVWLFFLRG
jgi:RsiW-degrading membrane proteinase PrsW (M82 family)